MNKLMVMIFGLIKYKDLLYELVVRDIKIRYRRSFLGLLWTLLNPIMMMSVMTLVFSGLFRFNIENYPIYFFTGNILFSFLTEATTNALYSVTGSGALIKKVYIPKYLFPMSKIVSGMVNLFFAYIAMLVVMLVTGAPFYATMLLTPILVVYLCLFALGLGLLLSTAMVFFRDIAHFYGVLTMGWMYMTPIFYPESLLQEKAPLVLLLNPMNHFIKYFRQLVLYNTVPTLQDNLICLGIGVGFLLAGMIVFYRKQDKFTLFI